MKLLNVIRKFFVYIVFVIIVISGIPFSLSEAIADVIKTDTIPWSGYWWPYNKGGLATGSDYRGHPAPIEKYLLWTTNSDDGDLKDWYLYYYYDPNAPGWHGLCPVWARAAVMEDYEILPSTEDNFIWRVGDKKGLLLLCHDYAIQTNVSGDDPVNFHLWLLDYIGTQKIPFLADLDAGSEVWYYPIYGYKMTSSTSGLSRSIRVTIYFADDNVFPDYVGTYERFITYTYTLDLNAQGEITGGQWTGNSVDNHPDNLSFPFSSGPKSPYIDCDEVRRLAQASDDFLETGKSAAVSINPGTYHLVLLDEDRYVLQGQSGDIVSIEVAKDDTSDEDINIVVSDILGEPAASRVLDSQEPTIFTLELRNPPYTISMTQDDYTGDPNIYTMTISKLTAFHQNVPYIPKSGPWSGFVMFNAGDEMVEDVTLVTSDPDGRPVQTLLGPVDFAPYEKQVVMFDDLPWRSHEYGDSDSLMLISNQPLNMLNLFALDQNPMAGFVQDKASGSHLVIPGTVADIAAAGNLKGSVLNESFDEAGITIRIYDVDGHQQDDDIEEVIAPGGKYFFTPGTRPFSHVPKRGWIDIIATDGNILSAYQYVKNSVGSRNAIDTLFALPVDGTTSLIVPHVTPQLGWWRTYLTLINPNDTINPVNLHFSVAGEDQTNDMDLEFAPFEKRVIDLTSEYGRFDGEPARSMLEITGQYPVVGYYTYSPPYGKDEASFPLINDDMLKSKLVLPHYAGQGGHFWTGICICNPNNYPVTVSVQPYDGNGRAGEDLMMTTMSLGAGEKEIFTVRSKFGDSASDISFIEFEENEQAPIGGFYLFGNIKNGKLSVEMLTGANM
ncbi:MAG: hypothetical protein HF978_05115 [Desulfobacteraceae bacterium]|nr:hypothetical protein [Desulfobacteraceae bacterium]MBC2754911.1 hypothetical protein [Desulfobacteraceae bacterium]